MSINRKFHAIPVRKCSLASGKKSGPGGEFFGLTEHDLFGLRKLRSFTIIIIIYKGFRPKSDEHNKIRPLHIRNSRETVRRGFRNFQIKTFIF